MTELSKKNRIEKIVAEAEKNGNADTEANQHRLSEEIRDAIKNTPELFPEKAVVACQGTEGAFSQTACERIFKHPEIVYFSTFESVFSAVDKGLCQYGIVPVENSTAGSVNAVYDRMITHEFKIVRSTRLRVGHSLLVNPGTKLSDIKVIYSHQQAISQCSDLLQELKDVKTIPCENTAEAARMLAESKDMNAAAIASPDCTKLYGLTCLAKEIQDSDNNYTRFICITKKTEIYPGADRTSLMTTLPHKPGALYQLLGKFYEQEINLNKIESRPLPGKNFEFMFYFDLDTPVYSEGFLKLMDELPQMCEEFTYLGSYTEII